MLITEERTNKERAGGHYEVIETSWATDYVWVAGHEGVKERYLDGALRPWHVAYAEWKKRERTYPEEQVRKEMEAL